MRGETIQHLIVRWVPIDDDRLSPVSGDAKGIGIGEDELSGNGRNDDVKTELHSRMTETLDLVMVNLTQKKVLHRKRDKLN